MGTMLRDMRGGQSERRGLNGGNFGGVVMSECSVTNRAQARQAARESDGRPLPNALPVFRPSS